MACTLGSLVEDPTTNIINTYYASFITPFNLPIIIVVGHTKVYFITNHKHVLNLQSQSGSLHEHATMKYVAS